MTYQTPGDIHIQIVAFLDIQLAPMLHEIRHVSRSCACNQCLCTGVLLQANMANMAKKATTWRCTYAFLSVPSAAHFKPHQAR